MTLSRGQIEEFLKNAHGCCDETCVIRSAFTQLITILEELDTLRAKVEKYGRHTPECSGRHKETGHYNDRIDCTCGFSESQS